MLHHLSLPSLRSAQPSGSATPGKTLSRKASGLFSTSLSKLSPKSRSGSPEATKPAESIDLDSDDDETKPRRPSKLTPIGSEEEAPNAARSNIRGAKPWHQSTLLRAPRKGNPIHSRYRSGSSPRTSTESSEQFQGMMGDLKLDALDSDASVLGGFGGHHRRTSSSYPSHGKASTRIQSPESMYRPNKLSFTNLSRYGRANDRLSNLRSTLASDESYDVTVTTTASDVMTEADTAIAEWQDQQQPRPAEASFHRSPLMESTEILPGDSASQQPSPSGARIASAGPGSRLTWRSGDPIKNQYDGIHEANNRHQSPDTTTQLPFTPANRGHQRPSKRKASVFSLHSLSGSISKHRKSGLRQWASSVYQQGSKRLATRLKWIRPARRDRGLFESWRTRRRGTSQEPSSPCREKAERTVEHRVCASEGWWDEGVSRFQAPDYMNF
ncbi:hypothetical protein BBK36DRAFT_1137590 [Trichoderma citrinoviride]|uniref:Uncharacterized protein n=1 Tax=Trichoderma citrinoviride TaxID=58853 RepID=A0A2T4BNP6_9HYPO|nr:hypothetical protein BBK36DRAFT_1137590 [Trichoderma citrinoviride]PTB70945.1 hypothetical protein BBK36DRAFT_1137590 [Trichoderma citrinoviride]